MAQPEEGFLREYLSFIVLSISALLSALWGYATKLSTRVRSLESYSVENRVGIKTLDEQIDALERRHEALDRKIDDHHRETIRLIERLHDKLDLMNNPMKGC